MSHAVFDYPPRVELLQWLAKSSLRQTDILSMATRLWVILRSLYGSIDDPIYLEDLGSRFRYPEWRDRFFREVHPYHRGDTIAQLHNSDCPCHKTLIEWLFDPLTGLKESQWRADFLQHYSLSPAEVARVLNPVDWLYDPAKGLSETQWRSSLQQRYQLGDRELDSLVRCVERPERERHKNRPFAVSRRTLKKDFQTLVSLGWLTVFDDRYCKVKEYPSLAIINPNAPSSLSEVEITGAYLQSDLADFVEKFALPINGVHRFFLHAEYIISGHLYPQIEQMQAQLKQIWSEQPVPPTHLTYRSSKLYQDEVNCWVYPVCLYYFQRAPYLIAYGQTPQRDKRELVGARLDWYDYRLDRIQNLQSSTWDNYDVPPLLSSWAKTPVLPERVSEWMSEALGFEFYQPKQFLLLRFDRYFYNNYIAGTERDELFQKLSHQQAISLVRKASIASERKQAIESILHSRPSQDAYRRVLYCTEDNNVIMRLRAWGPNVEVLLPWEMRERMRTDLARSWEWYQ